MSYRDFGEILDTWINEISLKNLQQLCAKPSPTSWSLGQLGMHLIEATTYYLDQVNICLSTNDNALEEMSPEAKVMFNNNEFPDEIIEGPPSNADTPQPETKEELLLGLLKLKEEIGRMEKLLSLNLSKGKTKHPGLRYFNAKEWFQFAAMHFRHHLRQKNRIETFLKSQPIDIR
jgi:DinB superfamily